MPDADPVEHVTERTAQNERQRDREQPLSSAAQLAQPHQDRHAHQDREHGESPDLPARTPIEEAESGAGVEHQRDIQDGQDAVRLVRFEIRHHPRLDELIEDDHAQGDRQPTPTRTLAEGATGT